MHITTEGGFGAPLDDEPACLLCGGTATPKPAVCVLQMAMAAAADLLGNFACVVAALFMHVFLCMCMHVCVRIRYLK